MNKIHQTQILTSLEDLAETNDWSKFSSKLIIKLYNTFKELSEQKWMILLDNITRNCEYKPVYATFYKKALELNFILQQRSEAEESREPELGKKSKTKRPERLNIISKHFPNLVKRIKK